MRAPRMSAVVMITGLAAASAACDPEFVITDSFTPPPEGLFAEKPDSLHDYAVGTELRLDIRAKTAFVDLNRLEVVSESPDLMQVLDQVVVEDELQVRLKALAAGTVVLNILNEEQQPIEERVVEVKLPDEIGLAVNIDPEKGYTIPVLDPENLLVAVGGATTFQVTYKKDGTEVKGKGVLVGNATTLTVENPTRENPDREFLTLRVPNVESPLTPVELLVAGEVIRTLQVRNTPLAEVAAIQLDEGDLPTFRNNGDVSTVWAKAFTSDATPIFGAPFAWTFESAALDGNGDLVSYTYAGGERRRIQVTSGEAVEDLTVEAKAGTAQVASTESPGCASAPVPLLVALLALLRRRRR